eukprot:3430142-Pleurochrysis_carterae.AAC.1
MPNGRALNSALVPSGHHGFAAAAARLVRRHRTAAAEKRYNCPDAIIACRTVIYSGSRPTSFAAVNKRELPRRRLPLNKYTTGNTTCYT